MHPVKFLKIFFLVFAASCGNSDAPPRNLLPEDQMVQVMADVHIFEAMAEGKKMSDDSLAVFVETNYNEIFKRNKVEKEQYKRTYDYYKNNPAKMDELMNKVIEELSRREADTKRDDEGDTQEAAEGGEAESEEGREGRKQQ